MILALLVVGAGGAVFLLLQTRVSFTNTLAAAVQVVVAGAPPVVVPAGATVKLPASFGKTLVAEWELVRPISADSAPMGETMHGSTSWCGARAASCTPRRRRGRVRPPTSRRSSRTPRRSRCG